MSKLTIKYIGEREILNFFELPEKWQAEFKEHEDSSFFKNRHGDYELFEFLRIENNQDLKSFHGYISDSFFSGSLCILDKDCQSFKLFEYYS